jgi:hypothetical protein
MFSTQLTILLFILKKEMYLVQFLYLTITFLSGTPKSYDFYRWSIYLIYLSCKIQNFFCLLVYQSKIDKSNMNEHGTRDTFVLALSFCHFYIFLNLIGCWSAFCVYFITPIKTIYMAILRGPILILTWIRSLLVSPWSKVKMQIDAKQKCF